MTPCAARPVSSAGIGKRIVRSALLLCVLGLSGCVSGPVGPLQAVQQDVQRQLTMRCYWQQEGERVVYGASAVLEACRDWAQRRMAARYRAPVVAYQ